MIYGYLRVSSDKQDVESQKQGVVALAERNGWTIDKYITDDGISGAKDPSKRKLGPLLKQIHEGDIIIASEISRLGRDLFMVMEILHHCMEKGCVVYTVKDNYVLGDNITSKVLAFAFGLAAEIERQMICQRTAEGLKRRRALGVITGRTPGSKTSPEKHPLYAKQDLIKRLLKQGVAGREIAQKCHVHRGTYYRYLDAMYADGRLNEVEYPRVKRQGGSNKKYKTPEEIAAAKIARRANARNNAGRAFEVVELPREAVRALILEDKSIPDIHRALEPVYGFTYDQVYDSIQCDDEFNRLYRKHAQVLVKRQLKAYK